MGGSLGNSSWGGGDFYGKCREILTEVEKHLGPNLVIFAAPVDRVMYPEYHKIVKQPMDLGTIRSQLDRQQYTNPQEYCDVSAPLSFMRAATTGTTLLVELVQSGKDFLWAAHLSCFSSLRWM